MSAGANQRVFAGEIGVKLLALYIGVEIDHTIVCQNLFGKVDAGVRNWGAATSASSFEPSIADKFAGWVVKQSKVVVASSSG